MTGQQQRVFWWYCPACFAELRSSNASHPQTREDAYCTTVTPDGGWPRLPLELDDGAYTLERRIGGGGMGAVYLARNRKGEACAVKILKAFPDTSEEEQARQIRSFKHEALRLGALCIQRSHGHRLTMLKQGVSEGPTWYFVMEYVPWSTLPTRVLPPRAVALLGIELARALLLFEAEQTVHSDIKPSNILVNLDALSTPDTLAAELAHIRVARARAAGEAVEKGPPRPEPWLKVADLGSWQPVGRDHATIVRIRAEAGLSVPYASPEQLERDDAIRQRDEVERARGPGGSGTTRVMELERLPPGAPMLTCASDMHAVGTTLWLVATGENPYPDRESPAGRAALRQRVPDSKRLPPELSDILAAALDPLPEKRPDAQTLITKLGDFLESYGALLESLEEAVKGLEIRALRIAHAASAPKGAAGQLRKLRDELDLVAWTEFERRLEGARAAAAEAAKTLDAVDGRDELAAALKAAEDRNASAIRRTFWLGGLVGVLGSSLVSLGVFVLFHGLQPQAVASPTLTGEPVNQEAHATTPGSLAPMRDTDAAKKPAKPAAPSPSTASADETAAVANPAPLTRNDDSPTAVAQPSLTDEDVLAVVPSVSKATSPTGAGAAQPVPLSAPKARGEIVVSGAPKTTIQVDGGAYRGSVSSGKHTVTLSGYLFDDDSSCTLVVPAGGVSTIRCLPTRHCTCPQ